MAHYWQNYILRREDLSDNDWASLVRTVQEYCETRLKRTPWWVNILRRPDTTVYFSPSHYYYVKLLQDQSFLQLGIAEENSNVARNFLDGLERQLDEHQKKTNQSRSRSHPD